MDLVHLLVETIDVIVDVGIFDALDGLAGVAVVGIDTRMVGVIVESKQRRSAGSHVLKAVFQPEWVVVALGKPEAPSFGIVLPWSRYLHP